MTDLKNKKLFLFDMDGTIYIDHTLFDGTIPLLDHIKKMGARYIFLTNNSSLSVIKYVEKLRRLGINATEKDFVTSVDATILYLKNKNYKKIYGFGTESFRNQLLKCGLNVTKTPDEDVDCVCMGFDTELTFEKIEDACILLNRGVDYVATNPDVVCPTWYGYVPDCGSVSVMLYNATNRKPKFIGKPEPEMLYLALDTAKVNKQNAVVIGDRLYTDIKSGNNAGVDSIFVLSGEGTLKDLKTSDANPTYVMAGVDEILEKLKK